MPPREPEVLLQRLQDRVQDGAGTYYHHNPLGRGKAGQIGQVSRYTEDKIKVCTEFGN